MPSQVGYEPADSGHEASGAPSAGGKSTLVVVVSAVSNCRQTLEGEKNALGQFGDHRDGKRGKLQIVISLLADLAEEPLAVRFFAGNTPDPSTVATQIEIPTQPFSIADVIFVGDRGMIKKAGKQKMDQTGFRYITVLTDPQIRLLLSKKTLQLELFAEDVGEAEANGVRYIWHKNPDEAKRIRHRSEVLH